MFLCAKTLAATAASTLVLAAFAGPGIAQSSFPNDPIRIVVAYPAGGTADAVGRTVAAALSEKIGVPVIVENQGGASGMIGTTYVSQADPDGYTLLMGANNIFSVLPHLSETEVDPINDLVPVAKAADSLRLLAVHPSVEIETIEEFVEYVSQDGTLNYASSGIGSTPHILTEYFLSVIDGEMTHIPYPGANPALNDVIAGHVDVMIDTVVIPQAEAGDLRGLLVFGSSRLESLPDVPTLEEAGFTDFPASGWTGLFAPAGTPDDVVSYLSETVGELYEDEAFVESLERLGVAPDYQEHAAFGESILNDNALFGEFLATLDIE